MPRCLLRALSGPTGHGQRPTEVPATVGSRFYDGTAFSLGNTISPLQDVQSFLYPLDNTPAMDFLLRRRAAAAAVAAAAPLQITGGGSIASGKFTLNVLHAAAEGRRSYRDAEHGLQLDDASIVGDVRRQRTRDDHGDGRERRRRVSSSSRSIDDGEPVDSDTYRSR